MIVPGIALVINFLIIMFLLLITAAAVAEVDRGSGIVSWGLTFGGVMNLLFTIATFVLLCMISGDIKKNKTATPV